MAFELARAVGRTQELLGQAVDGFVYPFGSFNAQIAELVREAGHIYARTTQQAAKIMPFSDPLNLHSSCHFLAPDFWGHSFEMTTEVMWNDFECMVARITSDQGAGAP